MKPVLLGLALALALLFVPVSSARLKPTAADMHLENQMIIEVNRHRALAGCGPLLWNAQLGLSAHRYNDRLMATLHRQPLTHRLNGSRLGARISATGYRWRLVGENLARNFDTPEAAVTALMGSPPHRANILKCAYQEIGVAYGVDRWGQTYWTQHFGLQK